MLDWIKGLWAKLNVHNVAQWGHSAAVAAVGVSGYVVANNVLPPDSKGYAVAGLVMAAATLAKQAANPGTWPQQPLLQTVTDAAKDVAVLAPAGSKAANIAKAVSDMAPVVAQVASNVADTHASLVDTSKAAVAAFEASAGQPVAPAVAVVMDQAVAAHDTALKTLTAVTDAAKTLQAIAGQAGA